MLEQIKDTANRILSVFSTFSFADFLDIVMVAVIIYICVRIIRETRAMQLVRGIVFVIVLYGIVSLLGMEASEYMLNLVFSNIFIILVILFSPEIRSILEQVGHGASSKSIKSIIHPGVAMNITELSEAVEAVCRACSNMSDKKIGALICFENNTLLGNVIQTGTEIYGKISTSLVENIFYPKSPLHDGAMVIRDGTVYAAGCILPLTKKTVSSSLGTRHRAAIGLSEESDAVIVIVSEETGAISVAKGGVLRRNISDGDLRNILTTEFLSTGSSSDDKIITKFVRRIKK
ncbi:MAG: diadenylate cyclase CdaA [Clostridiales bacterium]|nr:diadenylate cyclase CdaA [Clostridiales bacterium]